MWIFYDNHKRCAESRVVLLNKAVLVKDVRGYGHRLAANIDTRENENRLVHQFTNEGQWEGKSSNGERQTQFVVPSWDLRSNRGNWRGFHCVSWGKLLGHEKSPSHLVMQWFLGCSRKWTDRSKKCKAVVQNQMKRAKKTKRLPITSIEEPYNYFFSISSNDHNWRGLGLTSKAWISFLQDNQRFHRLRTAWYTYR